MQSQALTDAYENALPDDARVKRKKAFGTPAAFVKRQMFFGTFGETLIARVGPERAQDLIGQDGMQAFTPSPGQTWDDYVQLDLTVEAATVATLAVEALAWAAALPKKGKWRPNY
jgi:hypothetical protein